MTFQIPRADWVSDRLITERGEYAQFQMYTREGNDAVAEMLNGIFAREGLLPLAYKTLLIEGVERVRKVHPEIHDTEPEWAIVDAVNAFFATQGFAPIDRDAVAW
jgi:hypothetical protein